MSTAEQRTAACTLANILPNGFARCFARSPRTAQQLWQLAVAVRQAEGGRLADAVERITPERAQALRAIDRAQGSGADQERDRAWVELEALFQIDGSTYETFEARREWAAENLRGRSEDWMRRGYDRYALWGDMRFTSELARMVESARSGPASEGTRKRRHAVGLDAIPRSLAVYLECVERVRMTCEATGLSAPMAHFANALADVPFVIGRSADPVADRSAFVDRVLAGRDPDVLGAVRGCLCEASSEIRSATWRVVEGALERYREIAAQLAFDGWAFPDGVEIEACNGWEHAIQGDGRSEGPEMTRIVFVRDRDSEPHGDSARVSIRVAFDEGLRVVDVSVLGVETGNEFGYAADALQTPTPAF